MAAQPLPYCIAKRTRFYVRREMMYVDANQQCRDEGCRIPESGIQHSHAWRERSAGIDRQAGLRALRESRRQFWRRDKRLAASGGRNSNDATFVAYRNYPG